MDKKEIVRGINTLLGSDVSEQLKGIYGSELARVLTLMRRPDVKVRLNRKRTPYGVTLSVPYGQVNLDSKLMSIDDIYVNGARFMPAENGIEAIEKLLSGVDAAKEVIGKQIARQKVGRKARNRDNEEVSFSKLQEKSLSDLEAVGLNYNNLFEELSGLLLGRNVSVRDVADELYGHDVPDDKIAHFLVYESQFRTDIVSQVYGLPLASESMEYTFEPITAGEGFLGDVMRSLGVEEAEYDAKSGVLNIDGRLITNLPNVDENGVFQTRDKKYIPHYVGYFADVDGSRVERLRVVDPVQSALTGLKLQYDLSKGDIKFQTILDVTRGLPDFENHPYGDVQLATLKRKVVLDKSYLETNSLRRDYSNKTDSLGAVALTILDKDAEGVIDPYGTSNGSNMGVIFYLAKDAVINPDGSITPGESRHSEMGDLMNEIGVAGDNFNRNQMSFNAALTSLGAYKAKVAFAEFGLFNSDDAVVVSKKLADAQGIKVGDKLTDNHGDKGVVSRVIDPDMSDEEAEKLNLTAARDFIRRNPEVDMVVSPVSLASRLNMGVVTEAMNGEKSDLVLHDGSIAKDGIVELVYHRLPQTAEHKSKDYSEKGNGRKFSSLYRHVLASKIGEELYNKIFMTDQVREGHIDEVAATFQRLGISLVDDKELIKRGNVNAFVDAPITVNAADYAAMKPAAIRLSLMSKMVDGQINIDLGDMEVISPLTGEPITDRYGYNVLPIRVEEGRGIPYRYTEVFKEMSLGNREGIKKAYAYACSVDHGRLTAKDNLLKNINTVSIKDGAYTLVIVPDPTLKIGEVRAGGDGPTLIHRDPCIQSGNVLAMNDIGGGEPNVLHVNPLTIAQLQGDYDGDTVGKLKLILSSILSEEEIDDVMALASPYEGIDRYGEIFLGVNGSHFQACANESQIDTSGISLELNSPFGVAREVERVQMEIVRNPASYGAYALSFENMQSVSNGLGRLADDGIKGSRDQIDHYLHQGYTHEENVAVLKALIAKSEWTGMAGAITNTLISGFGETEFDPDLVRDAMNVTASLTQAVLQMKKNADKLPEIDAQIKAVKTVISGEYDVEKSREVLKENTRGLIPEEAIDRFVDAVAAKQIGHKFGKGVINGMDMSTTRLAYVPGETFGKALMNVSSTLGNVQ